MIEKPTKECVERLGRVFGRFTPNSVTLRGDGTGLYRHAYEVLLVYIHQMTVKYYESNPRNNYYLNQKHLAEQERTIWLLAYEFELEIERVLKRSSSYDFVVRPIKGSGTYEIGLADLIFITDDIEIPYVLDFQIYNHVTVEKSDKVHFIQLLHFYVIHYLNTRFPFVPKEKILILDRWIVQQIEKFDAEEMKRFYWYELEYRFVDESGFAENHQMRPEGDSTDTNQASQTSYKPKMKFRCSKDALLQYFDLLKQVNPKNDLPFLDEESVDWIVGYYFGSNEFTLINKPEIEPNIPRDELLFFIYQYSTIVSPSGKTDGSTPIKELVTILTDCFPKIFRGKPKGYADRIAKVVSELDSSLMDVLNLDNHKELKQFIIASNK